MSDKREFRAESKRLLDLMINSIYTNREIFLRELISNASDAIDKLRFAAISDASLDIDPSSFGITLTIDKENHRLIVSDTGIGMNEQELADNLGVIAASGTKSFRDDLKNFAAESTENSDSSKVTDDSPAADLIGQFGVGFYSAFMVAEHITVISRKYDSDKAFRWESDGVDGYTIEPAEKTSIGTDIILQIRPEKASVDDNPQTSDEYNCYLREYPLYKLVKKYSDYIRYPIKMLMPHPYLINGAEIEAAKAAGSEVPEEEYNEVFEYETLNSMIPLWQRGKNEVTPEQYNEFYKEHFSDKQDPMTVIPISVEGNITYKALLYIPSHASKDFNTEDYRSGLELYSSNVMIMNDCRELIPEEYSFVRGVVDSQDISLNISRETLQQNSDLLTMRSNISKKIRQELLKLLKNDREKYLEFYRHFGHHIKVCAMDDYGAKKDSLAELLLFYSGREKKLITLDEYVDAMQENQKYIYFASGDSPEAVEHLPQTDFVRSKGIDVLYFTDKADEFVSDMFRNYRDKAFKSIIDSDPELEGDTTQKDGELFKATFDFIKETLGSEIDGIKATNRLQMHPVCLSSGTGVTFEMEKYFKAIHKDAPIKAKRILEVNVHHPAFLALDSARVSDPDRAQKYCKILLNQAKMIAGLPIEDPSGYTDLLVSLWR